MHSGEERRLRLQETAGDHSVQIHNIEQMLYWKRRAFDSFSLEVLYKPHRFLFHISTKLFKYFGVDGRETTSK